MLLCCKILFLFYCGLELFRVFDLRRLRIDRRSAVYAVMGVLYISCSAMLWMLLNCFLFCFYGICLILLKPTLILKNLLNTIPFNTYFNNFLLRAFSSFLALTTRFLWQGTPIFKSLMWKLKEPFDALILSFPSEAMNVVSCSYHRPVDKLESAFLFMSGVL